MMKLPQYNLMLVTICGLHGVEYTDTLKSKMGFIKYSGPLPNSIQDIAGLNRSNLYTTTFMEPVSKHNLVMMYNLTDHPESVSHIYSQYQYGGSRRDNSKQHQHELNVVLGYHYFNDVNYTSFLKKKAGAMGIYPRFSHNSVRQSSHSGPLASADQYGTFGYLQKNFLSESQQWFSYNIQRALKADDPLYSLGVQAYATYPGTQRCAVGRHLQLDNVKSLLPELEVCCIKRTSCPYQSNMEHPVVTPKSHADTLRRTAL